MKRGRWESIIRTLERALVRVRGLSLGGVWSAYRRQDDCGRKTDSEG